MILNSLSTSLSGNDKSLSNSYLAHIVELLRTELAALTANENALNDEVTEHITTQKKSVTTGTVTADSAVITAVTADSVTTPSIKNGHGAEIQLLEKAVDVIGSLKENGKDVVTTEQFTGPFTYKGLADTLPTTASAGDVYIVNNKVEVYNGASWDSFDMPIGAASVTDLNKERAERQAADTVLSEKDTTIEASVAALKTSTEESVSTLTDKTASLQTAVDGKVGANPADGNSYVRKNTEWVELSAAENTVPATAGASKITNKSTGIGISTPAFDITTDSFKVNGAAVADSSKFGLSVTDSAGTNYHYALKLGRSPFSPVSSYQSFWPEYSSSFHTAVKWPVQGSTFITKNYQYSKFCSAETSGDNTSVIITAMDSDGNITQIPNLWADATEPTSLHVSLCTFMGFNPEYCPTGYEDTAYLFVPYVAASYGTTKCYLLELKDGKFSRKIDLYNGTNGMKAQGYTPASQVVDNSHYCSTGCGKALRSKTINRICYVAFNVASAGGNYAMIIGGNKSSAVTDAFDPTKCIYIPLPSTAYYSYDCMMATDSAWYLQEYNTGRIMKITPNGTVVEMSLPATCIGTMENYIEYTDTNGNPAAAFATKNHAAGGLHYIVFLEENNGQTTMTAKSITLATAESWYQGGFKFMENTNYILFTGDCGNSVGGGTAYGTDSCNKQLLYFDKKTLTAHYINPLYTFNGTTQPSFAYGFIEMHKTKGGTIWFVPRNNNITPAMRTGELKYLKDTDYTNIVNGVDTGSIELQSSTVGTTHSFFGGPDKVYGRVQWTRQLQGAPDWGSTLRRCQMSAVSNDGILCILSDDLMAYALCYGDGNIKVYESTSHDGQASTYLDCDAGKLPIISEEVRVSTDWQSVINVRGLDHGWLISYMGSTQPASFGLSMTVGMCYTYLGVQYKNGLPTILEEPSMTKYNNQPADFGVTMHKYEDYGYLETYDDYERRCKILSGIRQAICYLTANFGVDSWMKEVKYDATDKLNLTYDGAVISSVDK